MYLHLQLIKYGRMKWDKKNDIKNPVLVILGIMTNLSPR
jgi:hypothetical protein